MAKVELVKKNEFPTKWEPFATITLSKREAAGVLAAGALVTTNLFPYTLYSRLDKALGGGNDWDIDENGNSSFYRGEGIAKVLDKRFGKLVEE